MTLYVEKKLKNVENLIFFNVLIARTVINDSGDASSGQFVASNAAYIIAIVTLLSYGYIFVRLGSRGLPKCIFTFSAFAYYFWMLIWSPFSNEVILSSYNAVVGILYIYLAIYYSRLNMQIADIELRWDNINRLIIKIIGAYFIGSIYYYFKYYNNLSFVINGVPLGYAALLFAFLALSKLIDFYNTKKKELLFYSAAMCIACVYMKSFSALLAITVGLVYVLINKKKFLTSITFLSLIIVSLFLLYNFLLQNIGSSTLIFGKNINALLIGSGRFEVYLAGIAEIQNLDLTEQIKGIGFMAERSALSKYDLAWVTDMHNSLLMSILTGGVIAGIFYLMFIISGFLIRIDNQKRLRFRLFHVMSLFFGFTSTYYLGRPSYLLLISLIMALSFKTSDNNEHDENYIAS